jgi:asparagine synthetase B (glutamine-hydrolysing)
MFAFVLFDARQQTVFLARDRFGEKPLSNDKADSMFRFASELKALLQDYIYVFNLASGHVAALDYLSRVNCLLKLNLGTAAGHSVLEIVKTF